MAGTDDPGLLLEAAGQAMAAGHLDGAVAHLSAAIRALTAAGDNRQAALACSRLGFIYAAAMANKVAARPWFTRATRLLADEGPCLEKGWVAVAAMGCEVDDPTVLLEQAQLALDMARRFGDTDLEIKALADGGLAHVEAGRIGEGMAMIDEAMALICSGAGNDVQVAAQSVCSFFTACFYTSDLERVGAWVPSLRQHGLVGVTQGPLAILDSHCDSVHAALLCHMGKWREAERVLERTLAMVSEALPGAAASIHPLTALAELRILQGRLSEAEALLLGLDDIMEALLPTARLHQARGEHDLACATARRGLRLMGEDRVRAASLLGILVEAELGRGDLERAAEVSGDLDERTRGVGLPTVTAEAARVRARVRAAQGDTDGATSALQEALRDLGNRDLPRLRSAIHLDLARIYDGTGDNAASVVEARAAAAVLARIDVVLAASDRQLLDRLGAGRTPPSAGQAAMLTPSGSWWTAACGDTRVRLHDTKGLRYLAELIAHPGVERQALDLVDLVEGLAPANAGLDRRRLGDAGQLLDRQARAAYRRRVEELREEIEDALEVEDDDRAIKAQTELDAVVAELARAVGLGGRDRRASAAAEKARLNVTRALRAATSRVSEALPGAGAVLDRRLRTGLFCAYEPSPEDDVAWSVQPELNTSHAI